MTGMRTWAGGIAATTLAAAFFALQVGSAQQAQACSPSNVTALQKARRTEASRLARQINTAEAKVFGTTKAYGAWSTLSIMEPSGFSVQLATTSLGYIFTVKDTEDSCSFALFSDQTGQIYVAQPLQ